MRTKVKPVTIKEVKEAMLASGKKTFKVDECPKCKISTVYTIDNGNLMFDSNCDCVSYPHGPKKVSWNDPAALINAQKDGLARQQYMKLFKVPLPAEPA